MVQTWFQPRLRNSNHVEDILNLLKRHWNYIKNPWALLQQRQNYEKLRPVVEDIMLSRFQNHAEPACPRAGALNTVSIQFRYGFQTGPSRLQHGFSIASTLELALEPCAGDLLKPLRQLTPGGNGFSTARALSTFFNAASARFQ